MFENRESNRLGVFGSYFNLIITFVVSIMVFYILKLNEHVILNWLDHVAFGQVDTFFRLIIVVVLILIFNTGFYAMTSYKRYRMLIFATVFLAAGVLEGLYILQRQNLIKSVQSYFEMELQYGTFSRLISASGFCLAAMIPVDYKLRDINHIIYKVIPFVGLGLLVLTNYIFKGSVTNVLNNDNGKMAYMIIEVLVASMLMATIVLNLRAYLVSRNKYIVKLCSGVLVILFGQIFRVFYGHESLVNQLQYTL